jgi:hypothetical protein
MAPDALRRSGDNRHSAIVRAAACIACQLRDGIVLLALPTAPFGTGYKDIQTVILEKAERAAQNGFSTCSVQPLTKTAPPSVLAAPVRDGVVGTI